MTNGNTDVRRNNEVHRYININNHIRFKIQVYMACTYMGQDTWRFNLQRVVQERCHLKLIWLVTVIYIA
jgi:hypothetical protein